MPQDKADTNPAGENAARDGAPPSKLTVTWDDLQTRKVDQRLKEQDALARNRVYAAMDESTVAPPLTRSGGVSSVFFRVFSEVKSSAFDRHCSTRTGSN